MFRSITVVLCVILSALAFSAEPSSVKYPDKIHKIAVGGEGGWDYLTVDSDAKRLYVSRSDRVIVIDLADEKVVGELPNTPGIHGIAIAADLGKGFTSNGRDSTVTVFDPKTLKATGSITARGVPDAILYDTVSKRVITFNHQTDDATVIDAEADKVTGTIDFKAEPEAAVADGKGHVFVNLRSTSEVCEFDPASLKILNRWQLAPGIRPNGLGMDTKKRRLFSTCGNQKMVVMNADTGAVIETVDIGRGSDGCVFDPGTGFAYSSNGEGSISVVGETEPGKYGLVGTVTTQPGARTITFDPKTHRLYLSAATLQPPAEGQPQQGRRPMVPGSFVVLVVDK